MAGGYQALQALNDDEFDLVLLDFMMPDISGFDVLVRIKADERLRRVPVIMITALAETESALRCIEAGAEDYLPKPFDPILLRARINACIHKKRWRDREQEYLRRIEDGTAEFERLLLSILPEQVIGRLNRGETIIADRFECVSVSVRRSCRLHRALGTNYASRAGRVPERAVLGVRRACSRTGRREDQDDR